MFANWNEADVGLAKQPPISTNGLRRRDFGRLNNWRRTLAHPYRSQPADHGVGYPVIPARVDLMAYLCSPRLRSITLAVLTPSSSFSFVTFVYHSDYFFHFQPGYLHAAWGQPLTMAVGRRFSTCRFCDTVIAKSLELPEYPGNEGLSTGFAKMRGPWTLSTTEAIVFALLVLAIAGAGTWASAIG
jgi:hypothetical protein